MWSSTFFRRLFLPYLLLICAAVGVVAVLGAARLRSTYLAVTRQTLRDNGTLVAQLIRDDLYADNIAALNARLREIGASLQCRITVIDADGRVVADTEADPARMDDHRHRPEVAAALAQGEGTSVRASDTIHEDMLYVARRVGLGNGVHVVRLAVHLRDLDRQLSALYGGSATAALLAIVVAAVVSYYVARRRAAPLIELTRFADALAGGDLERRVLRRDKGEIGALTAALNSMADSVSRLMAQTERDKRELMTILSGMSEGVIGLDPNLRVVICNAAARQLLNIESDEVEGKLLWEVVRLEPVLRAVSEALPPGRAKTFRVSPSGGRHVEVSACPIPSNTDAHGVVLVIHDATESVRFQELRTEFVANVSHELRTPLTVIKGFAETLRNGAANDPAAAQRFLAMIEKHADQLTNLVNDLLDLSHLEGRDESGRLHGPVDLASLVRRTVDLLSPLAAKKEQTLTTSIDPRVPVLEGNAEYLERAVSNLIDNAIKYTPARGKIAVDLRREEGNAVVEVTDDGVGISAEELPRIFERFYRVDRSRSREMGGTGLGLSIVKHVAHVHHGTVEAHSRPGHGSTFRLKLPLRVGESDEAG